MAKQYVESRYRQPLSNGRYEPRRPGEPSSQVQRIAVASQPQSRSGRYAPTRPGEVRARGVASSPRRPNSVYGASSYEPNESSQFLETLAYSYKDRKLDGFSAEQMKALQEQFIRGEAKKRGSGGVLGKVVTFPVKLVFNVSKKVIGKVALDWWIPLL